MTEPPPVGKLFALAFLTGAAIGTAVAVTLSAAAAAAGLAADRLRR